MPMITIEYDNEKVPESSMKLLSESIQKIVSEVTKIEDVFVYANCSQIRVKVAPIEVFVWMSAHKISDLDSLIGEIKDKITIWKKDSAFDYPINLSIIPMNWKIEIGI